MKGFNYRICSKLLLLVLTMSVLSCESGKISKVSITSSNDVIVLFKEKNYTSEAWAAGIRDVPRIYITEIPSRWRDNSNQMPVITKKKIFFRLIAPLVLSSNEQIFAERSRLLDAADKPESDRQWLLKLASKYKLATEKEQLNTELVAELIRRVDIIPVSLALAQAAEESGWGTSRFAVEGNALFGQWDFTGRGMKPKQHREALGDYGVARFDSPQESVAAYMLNLNTHASYQRLRQQRAELRASKGKISGYELAKTLNKYSERGQGYVDSLHALMRVNKLAATDEAVLVGDEVIYLYPTKS